MNSDNEDEFDDKNTMEKIDETATFIRRLNNQLVQHVLVEGGSRSKLADKKAPVKQGGMVQAEEDDDDRFIDLQVGSEKEIEVFP